MGGRRDETDLDGAVRAHKLIDVYRGIESALGWNVTSTKRSMTRKDGSYIMIPFNPVAFARVLDRAKQIVYDRGLRKNQYGHPMRPKFIDVGAGLGFKVKIASSFEFEAFGVEFDKKYVDFARRYLEIDLMHRNALSVNYKEYDVIYFYRPIADERVQARLEDRILSTMGDDAIVIGAYATYSFENKVHSLGDEMAIKKGKAHLFRGI